MGNDMTSNDLGFNSNNNFNAGGNAAGTNYQINKENNKFIVGGFNQQQNF